MGGEGVVEGAGLRMRDAQSIGGCHEWGTVCGAGVCVVYSVFTKSLHDCNQ